MDFEAIMSAVPSPPRTSDITGVPDWSIIEQVFPFDCKQTVILRPVLERYDLDVAIGTLRNHQPNKRGGDL